MSEHTKRDDRGPRNRKPRRRHRTMEWIHDVQFGPEGPGRPLAVARFFVSLAKDEPPEVYFLPIVREYSGDGFKLRSKYKGDYEANSIPLSQTDLDALIKGLVDMKAKMVRMQEEYHSRTEPRVRPSVPPLEPVSITGGTEHLIPTTKPSLRRDLMNRLKTETTTTTNLGALAEKLKGW